MLRRTRTIALAVVVPLLAVGYSPSAVARMGVADRSRFGSMA
jgi:hypothetical protein